jgi:hypothetical protein
MKAIIALGGLLVAARLAVAQVTTSASTGNPHGQLALPCSTCHAPEGWVPARVSAAFDHSKSGFVLAGAHARAACRDCHTTLDFKGAPADCASCHRDPHRGELGADCGQCHTPRSFIDRTAMVRVHQGTRFPLTGSHLALDCAQCHAPQAQGRLTFVNRPSDCVDCHRASYVATTTPNHGAAGFTTNCTQCHATTVWTTARFSHVGTGFPLTGAHIAVRCTGCHGDGVYAGKSAACVSCHQAAYDATTDPNHALSAFPTDCTQCHTTSSWSGGRFTAHDASYFRIYSGAHGGRWSSCATCHNVANDYAQFTCLSCHGQQETNGNHSDVSGYSYNSQACYTCHRRS